MAKKITPHPKPKKAKHYLREWRKYRGLTQEVLAERTELTSGAISQLENGIINYTQPTLEALAYALNCEPGDLLSRDPVKEGEVVDFMRLLRDRNLTVSEIRAVVEALPRTGTDG